MSYTLILCEKPSVSQSISAVLGANKRGDGFFHGSGYIVSWCYGHLIELADPAAYGEQYKRWSLDSLPILPKGWKHRVVNDKEKQVGTLEKLLNRHDVESVVCATDAGREGELIFRLVYNFCKCKKPVKRLWISSLEDSAIREGFAKLRPGADFDNLYRAALCRSQADWAVGINGTRLFSALYGPTLNVGRVQTPTLAMIVDREKAIADFISTPFYTPEIDCGDFKAIGDRIDDLKNAEAVRSAADGADAILLSVEKTIKSTAPPKLYDLTSLQRDANKIFGFTAQQTLDYTQQLYEAKIVTYPRTDSQYITDDMEDTVTLVIEALLGKLALADSLSFVPDIACITDKAQVRDHHAILPTVEAAKRNAAGLASGEEKILGLICMRLLYSVAPVHKYEAVTAVIECGGYNFTAKGKTVLEDGWKGLDIDITPEEDSALPELSKGQIFKAVAAAIRECKTKPPARFTEGTLLRAMETAGVENPLPDTERRGLGTSATRAGIIEKIIKSGFVERQKKNLVPTPKGTHLIAALPSEVKSPLLTADWEQKLKLIEKGELLPEKFMSGIESLVRGFVESNKEPKAEMLSVFASLENKGGSGAKSSKGSKSVGSCPRCTSHVTESAKGFFCSSQSCRFALWKDSRFWSAKGKTLSAKEASILLKKGHMSFTDLKSERTGRTYAATIFMTDDGTKTDYKMEFIESGFKSVSRARKKGAA